MDRPAGQGGARDSEAATSAFPDAPYTHQTPRHNTGCPSVEIRPSSEAGGAT